MPLRAFRDDHGSKRDTLRGLDTWPERIDGKPVQLVSEYRSAMLPWLTIIETSAAVPMLLRELNLNELESQGMFILIRPIKATIVTFAKMLAFVMVNADASAWLNPLDIGSARP